MQIHNYCCGSAAGSPVQSYTCCHEVLVLHCEVGNKANKNQDGFGECGKGCCKLSDNERNVVNAARDGTPLVTAVTAAGMVASALGDNGIVDPPQVMIIQFETRLSMWLLFVLLISVRVTEHFIPGLANDQ